MLFKMKLHGIMKAVNEKISIRIFIQFTVFIIIISSSYTLFFIIQQSKALTGGLLKEGESFAKLLSYNTRLCVFAENRDMCAESVEGFSRQEHVTKISIFTPKGELLFSHEKLPDVNLDGKAGIGREKLALIKSSVRDSGTGLYVREDPETYEFWAAIQSLSDYPDEEELFFDKKNTRGNGHVMGYVGVNLDKSKLKQQLKGLLWKGLFIGAIFLIVVPAVTYIIAKGITRPIAKLNAALVEVGKGNMDVHMEVSSSDEVGRLAQVFNKMALALKEADELLRKANNGLEIKVAERTAELSAVNEQLQKELLERRAAENKLEKAYRELLQAKMRADIANRVKTDFLANMSHELSTPLNSIIGFSEILIDELPGTLNDQQKECLLNVTVSGRHLYSLLTQIFDYVQLESGDLKLEKSLIGLREAIVSAIKLHEQRAVVRNITLDLGPGPELELEADPGLFQKIMSNLISNAIKFTQDGGTVNVSARRVKSYESGVMNPVEGKISELLTQHSELNGKLIEISVEDTGIGISTEDMERLFQPFQQIETPYTKKYGGTGIGLFLTKKLVELHGGRIWVESQPGRGSKFSFTVPAAQVGQDERQEK